MRNRIGVCVSARRQTGEAHLEHGVDDGLKQAFEQSVAELVRVAHGDGVCVELHSRNCSVNDACNACHTTNRLSALNRKGSDVSLSKKFIELRHDAM
jgi:hypothetical protein